ncbi:MAG TPA: hypothetical protein VMF58_18405 [Rhizomicrobium sp.]|nr:hypothetical protein [Rhizomicrobium sp.]
MKRIGILSVAALMIGAQCLPAFATPAAPSATAIVGADGTLVGGNGVASAARTATGVYTVTFTAADVPTACAYTASIGTQALVPPRIGLVNVGAGDTAGTIRVYTYDNHVQAADRPFQVYVAC